MLDSDLIAPLRVRPLRRTEYDQLVDLGVFAGDERIELVRGVLVEMSPIGPLHVEVVKRLMKIFVRALGDRADVLVQAPFAAAEDSEPEPDLALVPPGNYARAHAAQAFLLVEVADTSLKMDRGVKVELYAASGVPEYWVVDLVHHVIEVRTGLRDGRYADTRVCAPGDVIRLVAFPDLEVLIADVLP